MRNYIILNGKNSNTINGLMIQELAPISKPLIRTQVETIDGRDGDIITPLGFSAYDKQITIGLYGNFDINEVIAYFNSEGTVTFSNEPDKYYNYKIINQINFERLVRFKTATVTLHCQPFKFATTGETQTLDSGDPVSDEGTNLVLEGSGEAPFSQFDLKGNTEQSGTPTPDAPQPVKVVTGENTIVISGKNRVKLPEHYSFSRNINFQTLPVGTYYVSCGEVIKGGANAPQIGDANNHVALTSGMLNAVFNFTGTDITIYSNGWNWSASAETTSSVEKLIITTAPIASIADYEPYQEQTYNIDLLYNLIVDDTLTDGYRLGADGTPYAAADYSLTDYMAISPLTLYTYSRSGSGGENAAICYYDSSKNFILRRVFGADGSIWTSTSPSNAAYARLTDLTTLLGAAKLYSETIKLAKINDLQDYIYKDGDKWYLHEEIGKVDLSTLTWSATTSTIRGATAPNAKYVSSNREIGNAMTDGYRVRQGSGLGNAGVGWFAVDTAKFNFNTGSSTNPTGMLYYELATPTDTEITEADLIEQLNDLHYHAHAYKERTHISSTYADGSMPHIIAAAVIGDASGTVTNSGNIYSKPKLTIFGSGDIGVYLNGVQMFQIALGSDGYITIDTALMEAYKDSLNTLKNRQVIGDYGNFKLPVGQSTISFSGAVTKCIVENFSRWL